MTIIGRKNNYGAICESVGIEIFDVGPVGARRYVNRRPSYNRGKKASIIPDEPRQMAIAAIKWICRKFE